MHVRAFLAVPSFLLPLFVFSGSVHSEPSVRWQDPVNEKALNPRDAEAYRQLSQQAPVAVRKMSSEDAGEMFRWEYWGFEKDILLSDDGLNTNASSHLLHPVFLHANETSSLQAPRHALRSLLMKRDFQCPTGTNSCGSVGANWGCCPDDTTCQISGSGSLGCCPGSSATCSGNPPTHCEQGYEPCPLFHGGGGCCLNGFACQSEGCVAASTTIVVVNPVVTETAAPSTLPSNPPTPVSIPAASTSSTTTTPSSVASSSTPLQSASSTSSSISTSTSTSTSKSTSTQITSQQQASSTSQPISAPVLPTSITANTLTSTSPSTSTITPCATGFYQCSAFYNAGACCQVGRDCGLTSCPGRVTTTALVSDGVTIAGVAVSGACATGWYTCDASIGGGCCPSGYGCGPASCTVTATAAVSGVTQGAVISSVAKENGAGSMYELRLTILVTLFLWPLL
jgi:progranulin